MLKILPILTDSPGVIQTRRASSMLYTRPFCNIGMLVPALKSDYFMFVI